MVNKFVRDLIGYIRYFDSKRPPFDYISSLKSSLVFYRDSEVKKYDSKFYEEIRKLRDQYFWYESRNVLILLVSPLLIFLIFAIFLWVALYLMDKQVGSNVYDIFSTVFKVSSFLLVVGYLSFAVYTLHTMYLLKKGVIGQEMIDKLKEGIRETIDHLRVYFRENNIHPGDHPIKLRHNDYEGLVYEEKGKNDYIAYVVME